MDNAEFFEAPETASEGERHRRGLPAGKIHAAIVIAVKRDFGGKEKHQRCHGSRHQ